MTATTYPSDAELEAIATEACLPILVGFVFGDYRPDLHWSATWPTRDEWESNGHRTLVCEIVVDEAVVGSLKDIGSDPLPLATPAG